MSAPIKDTSRFEGRAVKVKVALIEEFVTEGNVQIAVVRCPWCEKQHSHVVPEDVMPGAPLVRTAKCRNGGSQDYRLVRSEDWVEQPKREESKAPRVRRMSLDGRDLGSGTVVLCDGPDRIGKSSDRERRRIRQVFIRCGPCANVNLVPVSSLARGVSSCGCQRGRPRDRTPEYDAWVAQQN